VVALNLQPIYQTHFIPGASSSFALMLLANKNSKSQQQQQPPHSPSEEQVKNPSSQMPEIMYLDVDLQRARRYYSNKGGNLSATCRGEACHHNPTMMFTTCQIILFFIFFKIHFMFTIYVNSAIIISSFFWQVLFDL
jgi:hypothetical protein